MAVRGSVAVVGLVLGITTHDGTPHSGHRMEPVGILGTRVVLGFAWQSHAPENIKINQVVSQKAIHSSLVKTNVVDIKVVQNTILFWNRTGGATWVWIQTAQATRSQVFLPKKWAIDSSLVGIPCYVTKTFVTTLSRFKLVTLWNLLNPR